MSELLYSFGKLHEERLFQILFMPTDTYYIGDTLGSCWLDR